MRERKSDEEREEIVREREGESEGERERERERECKSGGRRRLLVGAIKEKVK